MGICLRIIVCIICPCDQRVELLACQDPTLAWHCQLTGQYFRPCICVVEDVKSVFKCNIHFCKINLEKNVQSNRKKTTTIKNKHTNNNQTVQGKCQSDERSCTVWIVCLSPYTYCSKWSEFYTAHRTKARLQFFMHRKFVVKLKPKD